MPEISNYLTIRDGLSQVQSQAPATPCQIGNGACCTNMVQMTMEDKALIALKFNTKQIPLEVQEKALKNSVDPKKAKQCPFLDENKKCLIYQYRPIICMAWGIGAEPVERYRSEYDEALQQYQQAGQGPDMPLDHLRGYSCPKCIPPLKKMCPSYPFEVVQATTLARAYSIQNAVGTIKEFVQKEFRRLKQDGRLIFG